MDLKTFNPKLWSMLHLQIQQFIYHRSKLKHKLKKSIHAKLWPQSVTLTFEVGVQVLNSVYCLIIDTICAKYFEKPLNYEEVIDRTKNIPYNRLCSYLTSKCNFGGRDSCFPPGISSYYYDYLCKVYPLIYEKDWTQNKPYICVMSKSLKLWISTRSDTKYTL
jgi:hypothetical protein